MSHLRFLSSHTDVVKEQHFDLHCLSAVCLTFVLKHPSTVAMLGSWKEAETPLFNVTVHVYDVRSFGKGVSI